MCQGYYNNFHRIFFILGNSNSNDFKRSRCHDRQKSGIAITSSTQFLMMSTHKISPKFAQQGRTDFISNFTISNWISLMFSVLEFCYRENYESFDIVVLNYYSSLKMCFENARIWKVSRLILQLQTFSVPKYVFIVLNKTL